MSTPEASMDQALARVGILPRCAVHLNLQAAALSEQAIRRGEATLSEHGALVVETGFHTGRAVQDKFIVDDPEVSAEVWWGKTNRRLSRENFERLTEQVRGFLAGQDLFIQDLFAGADPAHRIRIRVVTTHAWHALFARNMFLRPEPADLEGFEPDYVILHAPELLLDPERCGLRTNTAVSLSLTQKLVVIAGTRYAGEIKKSIFTVMNWLLPEKGTLPMHCSANIGERGDVALFFGLSGTGKTTLSSDPERLLIGDDEHGWASDGVFNFEGGCYAKVIDLDRDREPQIWEATHNFGTILENVVRDEQGRLDLSDRSLTENTRACYPIEAVDAVKKDGRGGVPRNVVMLTADAFGVLPPVAKLSSDQAMEHFIAGYTARVAGTEAGLGRHPEATFSTCFGAPFLPRAPAVYGRLLQTLLQQHNTTCWLVNTGWTGGAYGTGHRMSLPHTRAILRAVLQDGIAGATFKPEPFFGLSIPDAVPDVPSEVLDPRKSWPDAGDYDRAAQDLVQLFAKDREARVAAAA